MSKLAYLQTHFRDNGQGSPLTQGSRHGEAELPQPRDFSHMLWVFWLLGERGTPTPGLAGCPQDQCGHRLEGKALGVPNLRGWNLLSQSLGLAFMIKGQSLLDGKRSMLSSLRTCVQSLGPRWWEEKTDCQRLPSDLHTCALVHGLLSPHMPTKCGKKKRKAQRAEPLPDLERGFFQGHFLLLSGNHKDHISAPDPEPGSLP